jgi:hypothetical protein
MKTRTLIQALVLFLSATAWPSGADRYPLRQIDRPLVLPAKMWQERLIQNSVVELSDVYRNTETEPLQGFFPSLPSYSFTDRWMWMAVPAPYFRYLLIGNNIDSVQGPAAKGLSLALDGGVTGLVYSRRDASSIVGTLGLTAKRPLSSWAWTEGRLDLGASLSSEDDGDVKNTFSGSAGLGIQASDRIFFKPTYGLILPFGDESISTETSSLHYGTLEAGMNFTPNLSLGFQVSLIEGENLWLNTGANLAFQW